MSSATTTITLIGGPLDGLVYPAGEKEIKSAVVLRVPMTIRDYSCELDEGPLPSGTFFDQASQSKFAKHVAIYIPHPVVPTKWLFVRTERI